MTEYDLKQIDDAIIVCLKNRFPTIENLTKDVNWDNHRIDWIKNAAMYMWLDEISVSHNKCTDIIHAALTKYTKTGIIL